MSEISDMDTGLNLRGWTGKGVSVTDNSDIMQHVFEACAHV